MNRTEADRAVQKGVTAMSLTDQTWRPVLTDPAPEGVEVDTVIIGSGDDNPLRNHQSLVRRGRLWFFPDRSMYVYYEPTHWRPLGG